MKRTASPKTREPLPPDPRGALRDAGLRSTLPRLAVFKQLHEMDGPATHAVIAEQLADTGVDRATVYRILIDLVSAGLVRRSDHGDHLWRFELTSRQAGHDSRAHAHFLCLDCGQVECLPKALMRVVNQKNVPRSIGEREVEIQVKGLCDACAS